MKIMFHYLKLDLSVYENRKILRQNFYLERREMNLGSPLFRLSSSYSLLYSQPEAQCTLSAIRCNRPASEIYYLRFANSLHEKQFDISVIRFRTPNPSKKRFKKRTRHSKKKKRGRESREQRKRANLLESTMRVQFTIQCKLKGQKKEEILIQAEQKFFDEILL